MTAYDVSKRLKISLSEVLKLERSAMMKLKHPRNLKAWKEIKDSMQTLNLSISQRQSLFTNETKIIFKD